MQRQNDVYTENKLKFHVFQDERFVDLNLYQYGWERTEPLHAYGPTNGTTICFTMSFRGGACFTPTKNPTASRKGTAS